jgi:peptidoglycan/xylan/chitin deacetylase (PgdA/CDA1 family)
MKRLLTQYATICSSAFRLQRIWLPGQQSTLTTILYHSFFENHESREAGRSRLRKQCELIRRNFTPLSATEAIEHLGKGTGPRFPLTVTIDDALIDLLEAKSVFDEFDIPITIFVVPGWTDQAESKNITLSRILDYLHWYTGPPNKIKPAKDFFLLVSTENRFQAIDTVLAHPGCEEYSFQERLWKSLQSIPREQSQQGKRVCTWAELGDLRGAGVEFASHSITHCRLAECGDLQLRYELTASKQAISDKLGECRLFAYPYGTEGTYNQRTTDAIENAGYQAAFLTRTGFAASKNERFTLPRITIPDHAVPLSFYQALIEGGKMPFQKANEYAKKYRETHKAI